MESTFENITNRKRSICNYDGEFECLTSVYLISPRVLGEWKFNGSLADIYLRGILLSVAELLLANSIIYKVNI